MEALADYPPNIISKLYEDCPLLSEKIENTWNIKFKRELDMTNAVHLLQREETSCPLYEGKMIWQFDSYYEKPQYWANFESILSHVTVSSPLYPRLAHRRISASTNERTLVTSLIPGGAVGETNCTVIWLLNQTYSSVYAYLACVLNSFVLDFIVRYKITTTLNMFYMASLPVPRYTSSEAVIKICNSLVARSCRLMCVSDFFSDYWTHSFSSNWQLPAFWYPSSAPIDTYGPAHEQEIRRRLRDEARTLTPEWGPHCGVHDRLPDRRDTGDRAQLRAEIDAYVAHLYGLSRDDFAYILDTFPVLKKKEKKAFGEFMSKRKCLEEYDRIKTIMNAE